MLDNILAYMVITIGPYITLTLVRVIVVDTKDESKGMKNRGVFTVIPSTAENKVTGRCYSFNSTKF